MNIESLLSVIVPVYNVEPYLKNCLNSILAQTYHNLEVICINDGSTDNSLNILKAFAEKDNRIKVIDQANSGVSAARNIGIDHSTGEYVTFVDSDDIIDKNMYSTLISLFSEEDIDIVHCGYRRIDPDGKIKDVMGTGDYYIHNALEAEECLITGKLFTGSLCNKIYKRTLFQGIRLEPGLKINEDILLNVQLFLKSRKSCFKDLPLYIINVRYNSATTSTEERIIGENSSYVSEKIWELFKNTDLSRYAAERLYKTLINQYHTIIVNKKKEDDSKIKGIRKRINQIKQYCGALPKKQVIRFEMMRYFPIVYKPLYHLYDKIRVANWDVN